jgi:hypothetical protein
MWVPGRQRPITVVDVAINLGCRGFRGRLPPDPAAEFSDTAGVCRAAFIVEVGISKAYNKPVPDAGSVDDRTGR